MEFYPGGADLPREARSVSIPNGMEFYETIIGRPVVFVYGFNSQRDGILPSVL